MPVLDTTLNRFNKYLGFTLSLEELEEILFKIGFELDSAKKTADGYELKIEITPDRPDCLSTVGLARAIRLYVGKEKPKKYIAEESNAYEIYVDSSVLGIRPYIAAVVVKGLKLEEEDIQELIWTQEKLHSTFCRDRRKASIGFYPLKKISWPLRYYAEKPEKIRFRPLGFEEYMNGREILEKHPTGLKYADILKGHERYPLFVDARGNVLSLPPIINSFDYGQITVDDHEILVETTGTHKETMVKTINILATILSDMGGELYAVRIIYPEEKIERSPYFTDNTWPVDLSEIRRILGIKLSKKRIEELIGKMGYLFLGQDDGIIKISVPPYRVDIFHTIDIIDDIARAYGFDNFVPELTPVFTVGRTFADIDTIDFIRDALVGLGFNEAYTFALTSIDKQFNKMRLDIPENIVKIAGAREVKLNIVRYWLLPELLEMLAENKAAEYPIKLFEIEDVVTINESLSAKAQNYRHLALLISAMDASYTQMKSTIEFVFEILGKNIKIKRDMHRSFIEGRCAAIYYSNKKIGIMGEIHPQVLLNFGITIPVVAAEVDLTDILGIEAKEVEWA